MAIKNSANSIFQFNSLWKPGSGNLSVVRKGSNSLAIGDGSVNEAISSFASASTYGITTATSSDDILRTERNFSVAQKEGAHAEGNNTYALGKYSHAEGDRTAAIGNRSHAEGSYTTASGAAAHAEGANTYSNGNQSHAEGNNTSASGNQSHAEGNNTSASGLQSHAEGSLTQAEGIHSHAEGERSRAKTNSHAEGYGTHAGGECTHAEGNVTFAYGFNSHAEGLGDENVGQIADTSLLQGYYVTAGTVVSTNGRMVKLDPLGSITEMLDNIKPGCVVTLTIVYNNNDGNGDITKFVKPTRVKSIEYKDSYIWIEFDKINTNFPSPGERIAEMKIITTPFAFGDNSHTEGHATFTTGENAHAEGHNTRAFGNNAHAEGLVTSAQGPASHSEGKNTSAIGEASHVEGFNSISEGTNSHAEGVDCVARGNNSHAEGKFTQTSNNGEHAEGVLNYTSVGIISSVGIGTSEQYRTNAIQVMSGGQIFIHGVGGFDGSNTSNTFSLQEILARDGEIVLSQGFRRSTCIYFDDSGDYRRDRYAVRVFNNTTSPITAKVLVHIDNGDYGATTTSNTISIASKSADTIINMGSPIHEAIADNMIGGWPPLENPNNLALSINVLINDTTSYYYNFKRKIFEQTSSRIVVNVGILSEDVDYLITDTV